MSYRGAMNGASSHKQRYILSFNVQQTDNVVHVPRTNRSWKERAEILALLAQQLQAVFDVIETLGKSKQKSCSDYSNMKLDGIQTKYWHRQKRNHYTKLTQESTKWIVFNLKKKLMFEDSFDFIYTCGLLSLLLNVI